MVQDDQVGKAQFQGRSRRVRMAAWVTIALIVVAICSCTPPWDAPPDSGPPGETPPPPLDIHAKFAPGSVLYAVKNNNPYILINEAPELAGLKHLKAADQEEHLLKRALVNLLEDGLGRKEYEKKDHFVIKMVLMTQVDEYGRGNWGNARELAELELNRSSVQNLRPDGLDTMPIDQVRALFTSSRMSLDNIIKAQQK